MEVARVIIFINEYFCFNITLLLVKFQEEMFDMRLIFPGGIFARRKAKFSKRQSLTITSFIRRSESTSNNMTGFPTAEKEHLFYGEINFC
jgi:hypothetical protein